MSYAERAILQTLAYHAIFQYPLTREELYDGLIASKPLTRAEFNKALARLVPDRVTRRKGFVTLRGHESFIAQRIMRYAVAEKKFRYARRFVAVLRLLPFVRMVAVSNTLSYSNARDASDIDFFILAQPGHIWTARLFVAGYAALIRKRPTPFVRKDRFCLCFYKTVDHASFSDVQLDGDIHLPYLMTQMYPLYDAGGYYEHFWKTNIGVRKRLPHAQPIQSAVRRRVPATRFSSAVQKVFEFVAQKCEPMAKRFQMRKMPQSLAEQVSENMGVVLSDHTLKFHENDKRITFTRRWNSACKELLQE